MTNHKWNILNIMRFYNKIGKQFNAQVYMEFIAPGEGSHAKMKNTPSISKVYEYIRRFISNGWCFRDGDNVVMTQKGLHALHAWEKTRYIKQAQVSNETLRRRDKERDVLP